MSIKKKLGLGMASAALGLSLVGGGTFAYFSDEATIHNAIQAGTLSFDVVNNSGNHPINFDLSNFRPGDSVQRTFKLTNTGSLAIEKVFMKFKDASVKDKNGDVAPALKEEFLKALTVDYFYNLTDNDVWQNGQSKINIGTITLWEALYGDISSKIHSDFYDTKEGKINLTKEGIDSNGKGTGKSNGYVIRINFPETGVAQNQFQGLQAKFDFHLDARQVMGNKAHPQAWGPNGHIVGNEGQGTSNPAGVGAQDGVYKVDPAGQQVDPAVTRPTGFERP